MEVRDPVHGSIEILDEEVQILESKFFQRLRGIKQLGFSEFAFPGATHTRYLHSIGVMHIADKVFQKIMKGKNNSEYERLKQTLKLACLLHDIGHAPLSHSTEAVMPILEELKLPVKFTKDDNLKRRATHEDYTIKAITDSSFLSSFDDSKKKWGINTDSIAELILGKTSDTQYFTVEGINYFPVLHQLVSSELDCDRMDYLLRDSYFCGVSYGKYDLDWIIDNLGLCIEDNKAYLGINERALRTFDDFLLSRFHMFLMVYFHYRSVCLEQLLLNYFNSSPNEYHIPADIEDYQNHDDHFIMKVLRTSKNPFAQKIVSNKIPLKIYESFNSEQLKKLNVIQEYLESKKIPFIRSSSQSRLSKYYQLGTEKKEDFTPLRVIREFKIHAKTQYQDIGDATSLFKNYSDAYAVNRLHCDFKNLSKEEQTHILNLAY